MSIQNVPIIDNLNDLKTAFELLKQPWINHPDEYREPYDDAFKAFQTAGFPDKKDVSFKHINAVGEIDLAHKYLLIEGSLRLAVSQNIISFENYEKLIACYEGFFLNEEICVISKTDENNLTFDWV